MLDLVQIILACGLLSDLGETQLRDPDQIGSCPRPDPSRWTLTRSQKELAQAMTRPRLILLGCFAGTHQIAQGLRTLIRNPYRRKISGSIAACQLLGIPPIRLDSI